MELASRCIESHLQGPMVELTLLFTAGPIVYIYIYIILILVRRNKRTGQLFTDVFDLELDMNVYLYWCDEINGPDRNNQLKLYRS